MEAEDFMFDRWTINLGIGIPPDLPDPHRPGVGGFFRTPPTPPPAPPPTPQNDPPAHPPQDTPPTLKLGPGSRVFFSGPQASLFPLSESNLTTVTIGNI
jgi:hypothetical protein